VHLNNLNAPVLNVLNIKLLSKDAKRFKSTLRTYLTEQAFYSLDEYYQLTS